MQAHRFMELLGIRQENLSGEEADQGNLLTTLQKEPKV